MSTTRPSRRVSKKTSRDRALEISDALADAGISHTVAVRIAENFSPRETYQVDVTPVLTYAPTDITALQRLADVLQCEISFCAGSFTFVSRASHV
jgi:hypothetical protein